MRRSGKILLFLGVLLMVCSLGVLFLLQYRAAQAESINAEVVQIMDTILIDRREGEIDPEREPEMPALEINDEDFIALLEIPSYGLRLPICNIWDKEKVFTYPCRLWGSAYDGTLIVGGYDQTGQFDFFDRIQDGAGVIITDMTGSTFSYVISRVERSDSAEAEVLLSEDTDLTLFVRDAQSLEYIIVRCVSK